VWFPHILNIFSFVFVISSRLFWFSRLSAEYCCPVLVRCSFVAGWKIKFGPVQIQSMTFVSSLLQIRMHGYSGHFNIVKYVGLCNMPFYAINTDAVSLFADSSFLFLAILSLYCINVLFSIWMNEYLLFSKKIRTQTFKSWIQGGAIGRRQPLN
jgi:hypothetical protein